MKISVNKIKMVAITAKGVEEHGRLQLKCDGTW